VPSPHCPAAVPDPTATARSACPAGRPGCEHGALVSWPGPDPAELADGALAISTTAPRTGVVVVRAIGEIDLLTAPAWRRGLVAATRMAGPVPPGSTGHAAGSADHRAGRLVCDLSSVTFLGAAGLTVLLELSTPSAEHDLELALVAPGRSPARRLLELSGLDRRLLLHHDLSPALVAVPAPRESP
jgi:anti-sigma B factor antagonist